MATTYKVSSISLASHQIFKSGSLKLGMVDKISDITNDFVEIGVVVGVVVVVAVVVVVGVVVVVVATTATVVVAAVAAAHVCPVTADFAVCLLYERPLDVP